MNKDDVTIDYTNHRGERFTRDIRPERIWFGTSEWHTGQQWFLEAHDYLRDGLRNFALTDIHGWSKKDRRDGD